MSYFVELTCASSNRKLLINLREVLMIEPLDTGCTNVVLRAHIHNQVKETPEQIMRAIPKILGTVDK